MLKNYVIKTQVVVKFREKKKTKEVEKGQIRMVPWEEVHYMLSLWLPSRPSEYINGFFILELHQLVKVLKWAHFIHNFKQI